MMSTEARRSRPLSAIWLFVALAAIALLALLPSKAAAAGNGSISGKFTGASVPFVPYMCWITVSALDPSGTAVSSDVFEFSSVSSDGDGTFKLENLPPDTQYKLASDQACGWYPDSYSYLEYYSDADSLASATPITVRSEAAVTGIEIDLAGPDTAMTAPDTTIDSGPTGTVKTDEATFAFSSSDPANTAGFECQLDSGAFEDCSSPTTISNLGDGSHTVSVRAVHAVAGNEDQSPATRTFTVDTPAAPKARISKVTVKGPAKARKGKKVTFRVKITNSGKAKAKGVSLIVEGRGVSLTRPVGTIPARTTRTVKVTVRPGKAGKSTLTFRATSSNGGSKSAGHLVTVRK